MASEAERVESFEELAASRRRWIDDVLRPWCRQACLRDLREAEHDWVNIAGRVDPAMTLYTWAWSRFPALVHEGIPGLDETCEVRVELQDGTSVRGFPDNRESQRGELRLTAATETGFDLLGPYSIDRIVAVEPVRVSEVASPTGSLPPRMPTTLPPGTPDDQRV